MERVVWTAAAKKRLRPRRGSASAPSLDGAWDRIRTVFATIESEITTKPLRSGEIEGDPAGVARALELLQSKAPPSSTDLLAAACMRALLTYTCWKSYEKNVHAAIARHWIATGGVELAINALAASRTRHWLSHERALSARILTPTEQTINQDQHDEEEWLVVRSFLACADDATRKQARAAADRAWPTAGRGLRCEIAYALPGEDDLAREALGSCVGEPRAQQCARLLYATCRDAKFIEELAAFAPPYDDDVYEIVASLGADAFPFARDAFDRAGKGMAPTKAQKDALAPLSLIESKQAADFIVSKLPNARLRQPIVAYCKRSEAVAIPALEAAARREGKKSPAADVLALLVS